MPGVDEEVMTQIMNLKANAPGLRIYISLGGWDYSDNDTTTQAVFGDLASTAQKRATFIGVLDKFMRTWGLDGVDIDWEYVSHLSIIPTYASLEHLNLTNVPRQNQDILEPLTEAAKIETQPTMFLCSATCEIISTQTPMAGASHLRLPHRIGTSAGLTLAT